MLLFILHNPPFVNLVDRHRAKIVQLLASSPNNDDKVRVFEQKQVFGHGLTRHIEMLTKLSQRLAIVLMEHVQQAPPARIRKRLENLVCVSNHASYYATKWLHIVAMDDVFRALADGSRRELLDRLYAHNGQTLNELCARLAESGTSMTRQAVSKHLAILEGANLVATVKRGREKLHYLNPVPIHEIAERWIGKYERHRLSALAELKRGLEAKT